MRKCMCFLVLVKKKIACRKWIGKLFFLKRRSSQDSEINKEGKEHCFLMKITIIFICVNVFVCSHICGRTCVVMHTCEVMGQLLRVFCSMKVLGIELRSLSLVDSTFHHRAILQAQECGSANPALCSFVFKNHACFLCSSNKQWKSCKM